MRRRRPEKRKILQDPIYKDLVVAKFINYLMKDGKKSIAEKIFYKSLDIIKNQEKTIDDEVNETRRSKPPEEMNVAEKTVEALANVFRQAKSCTLGLFT